ncbi:MAG TPA: tetrahydromethanopterin S-methyltransferase subunit C [Ilumatobacteraceae bacterium]|nr:tetrahydromethanopterin S-methyltransferase subunit C [Ilumatobacteraceae bacterium]
MANDGGVQPGWYADPLGRFELRYYNGATWTADVSDSGQRFIDPLGVDLDPIRGSGGSTGTADDASNTNSVATASMVLGIIGVAIAWIPFIVVFGAIAAVLAVVFGLVALRRSERSDSGRSRAVIGLVTGASGLIAASLGAILTFVVLDVYETYVDPPPHEATITSCEIVGSRAIASGRLANLSDNTSDFSVLVGFVRAGTDNPHRTSRVVLDDVEPNASSPFEAERQVDLDEVDCIVIEVTGPLPFGLALD